MWNLYLFNEQKYKVFSRVDVEEMIKYKYKFMWMELVFVQRAKYRKKKIYGHTCKAECV